MEEDKNILRAFIHGKILTPESEIEDGSLLTRGPFILAVGRSTEVPVPEGACVVDCTDKIVVPGFIDLHVHGGGGFDFRDEEALAGAARYHASHGTTSLLPTLCPDTLPRLEKQLSLLGKRYPSTGKGPLPEILGLHLEGPFLNPRRRGVFDPGFFAAPQPGMVRSLFEASGGTLRLMTLAPEIPGGMEAVEEITEAGIIASLGHSDATYEQSLRAFSLGVRHTAHLWNAMRGFHHREPGCAMAALLHPGISVEVIVDGHHLHEMTLQLIRRLKGAERMVLVSDAVPLSGLDQGSVLLGGRRVTVREGRAVDEEGNLAGSLLTMGGALKKAVQWARIPLKYAVRMATLNPARLLGVSQHKGRFFTGGDADLVILSEFIEVEAVYIGGTRVSS